MNKTKRLNTSKKFYKNNALFMSTPYKKSTILENASHSREDKTLLTKHDQLNVGLHSNSNLNNE
jgi:hypothetical protein